MGFFYNNNNIKKTETLFLKKYFQKFKIWDNKFF